MKLRKFLNFVVFILCFVVLLGSLIQFVILNSLVRRCDEMLQQEQDRVIAFDAASSKKNEMIKKETVETCEIEFTETTAEENIYIGTFKLTAYCSCSKCCGEYADNRPIDENGNDIVYGAIGEVLVEGYSIAVDPKVIPYRTEVLIDGNVYRAQDCGGGIIGNEIDVYFSNHQSAKKFGVQYKDVYIIAE